jgi:serine/threonine protein kinase/tetratricopeptide (TPR) repeat protein
MARGRNRAYARHHLRIEIYMDTARWQLVQSLFHRAADVPAGDQCEFLRTACAGDETLVDQVLKMLHEDARSASLLDRALAYAADPMIDTAATAAIADQAFGPYRLVRVLGEGGAGIVYLAERDDLGSIAAIKILRDAWLSPARRERFTSEQRILAQLNHPAIARLYDADTLPDGTPWFAMECVEGIPLTEYCRRRDASLAERLRLFLDVCEAVQYAHRQMVVHRDLKPSNLLVRSDGGVKLLDFGISKQLDVIDPTITGLRLMTPAYAAPEQIRGGATGVQTDVYALGAILYELLVGRPPFDLSNHTPGEAERIILDTEPIRPSLAVAEPLRRVAGKHAWADLDTVCLTAMHKDTDRRYGSVESVARDVTHHLRCEPLEARPDSLRYRAGTFVRRNRARLSAAAAVFAVIVSLVVFYTMRLTIARNTAIAETHRTERIQRFMLNLFDGGERDAAPAGDLRVVALLDRGVAQARALEREPLVQAELYQTLGGIYQRLGKFELADTLLQSALEVRRSAAGSSAADEVRSLVALALLRSDQARVDEAERIVRDALRTARQKLRPTDPVVATATRALGAILQQRGRYDEAISVLDDAVLLQSGAAVDPTELAATLLELANTHFYAGHLDVSESLNRRVLPLHRQLYGDRHPLVAEDLINLGAIEHERGHYPDAERFYREALEINQAWYGKESYETASNLTVLGRSLVFETRYDEAKDLLQQAVAIQEHVFGAVHPRVASALNELGNVAMKRNHPDEAEACYRRIGDIYRSVYGDKHYLVAIAHSNLAGVFMARKDYSTAERMYREAASRFSEAQSPDHLNTGIARIKLGRSLLLQQRYADAENETVAGYRIVSKQAAPTVSWLRAAREDLASIYDGRHEWKKAEMMRAEAAQIAQSTAVSAAKSADAGSKR